MFKLVGRKRAEYFEFLTLLSDVQSAINSRPLTYRCSEDAGLDIITPNDFLYPHFNAAPFLRDPEKIHDEWTPTFRESLLERLEIRDLYLKEFHDLWYKEYLREQSKDLFQVDYNNLIKVDDVVVVKNPLKSRPYWSFVGWWVMEVTPGDDDLVRSVKIRKPDRKVRRH